MFVTRIAILIVGLLCAYAPLALADDTSPWRLGIAVGYGERSNPLVAADDISLLADIDLAWFGKRFYFDNGDVGVTLMNNDKFTLSLAARANSDRVFFGRTNSRVVSLSPDALPTGAPTNLQITVPDRRYAIEAGLELLADGRWGRLQASMHHDISGTHDGFELSADYSVGRRFGRLYVEPSLGLNYKSKALNNYYWGVAAGEANPLLPASVVGDGFNVRTSFRAGYYLSRRMALVVSAHIERINSEAAASVIVAEDTVKGYFAGLSMRL
ncbi:MAG: MipA/OmpV family protein [Gammaproteobacteria bacterium]